MKLKKDIVVKVERIFKEWQNLKKNQKNKPKYSQDLKDKERK